MATIEFYGREGLFHPEKSGPGVATIMHEVTTSKGMVKTNLIQIGPKDVFIIMNNGSNIQVDSQSSAAAISDLMSQGQFGIVARISQETGELSVSNGKEEKKLPISDKVHDAGVCDVGNNHYLFFSGRNKVQISGLFRSFILASHVDRVVPPEVLASMKLG
jgi:hypothetical protein